jgi:aspartyl-tRNA(Asn)/glutamyl-tRNA(Gln) amidotransferase subunit B
VTAWVPVIGLEVHVQLATASKAFSASATRFGAPENSLTDPVVLGLPGALPVFNRRALELALRLGLACGCTIRRDARFARKHYFYPDLPKGYQISQLDEPLCEGGAIELDAGGASVPLTRIHLEEDAGKSSHAGAWSRVDLNRAGVPLVEVVSEPAIRSAAAAAAYMRALHRLVRWLGVSDGDLEKGQLRCDANVSLHREGEPLGTRTELKNINSFRFVEDAIEHEIARQAALLDRGERVVQETRLWDADARLSRSMRGKEEALDYRYLPDPDLPPLQLGDDEIEAARAALPELPVARQRRWIGELGLGEEAARVLGAERVLADWFDAAATGATPALARAIANWTQADVLRELGRAERDPGAPIPMPPAHLAELGRLIEDGVISGKIAKDVFARMLGSGEDPAAIVRREGLTQVADAGALQALVDQAIAANPKAVADFKSGKTVAAKALVGQVMKASGGKANPAMVDRLVQEKLSRT